MIDQIGVRKSKILDFQSKIVQHLGKTGNVLWIDEMHAPEHVDRKCTVKLGKDEWLTGAGEEELKDS